HQPDGELRHHAGTRHRHRAPGQIAAQRKDERAADHEQATGDVVATQDHGWSFLSWWETAGLSPAMLLAAWCVVVAAAGLLVPGSDLAVVLARGRGLSASPPHRSQGLAGGGELHRRASLTKQL